MQLFNRKKNETGKNKFKIFNYIPHIILIIILISSIILVFFNKKIIIENINSFLNSPHINKHPELTFYHNS